MKTPTATKKKLEVLFKAYFHCDSHTEASIKNMLEATIPKLKVKSLEIYEGKSVVKAVVSSNIIDLVCPVPGTKERSFSEELSNVSQVPAEDSKEKLEQEIKEQKNIIKLFQEQVASMSSQVEVLDMEKTVLTKENQSLNEKIKGLMQKLAARTGIKEVLEKVPGKKGKENFQKHLEAVEKLIIEKQKAVEEERTEYEEKINELNVKSLAEKEKLEEKIDKLEQSLQEKSDELAQTLKKIEETEKANAEEKARLDLEIAELNELLKKSTFQLEEVNKNNKVLSDEIMEAKKIINEREEFVKELKTQVKLQSTSVASTISAEEEDYSSKLNKEIEEEKSYIAELGSKYLTKKDEVDQLTVALEEYKKTTAAIISKLRSQLANLMEENHDLAGHVKSLQEELSTVKEQNVKLKSAMCEAATGKAKGLEIIEENKELLGEVICAYKALQTHAKDLIFLYESRLENSNESKKEAYLEEIDKYQTLVDIAKAKINVYEQRMSLYQQQMLLWLNLTLQFQQYTIIHKEYCEKMSKLILFGSN
eukprot:TRINITY_DN120179_c0_g1_i1.p2 TRINITY_DN120179_c0_g1~~TRINITY_DN120179_c0_g1_i1.p2  ORF type:complete len:536 (-),score=119.18 TRINITY_DN120179_c0_g1_i1:2764-4371(-)